MQLYYSCQAALKIEKNSVPFFAFQSGHFKHGVGFSGLYVTFTGQLEHRSLAVDERQTIQYPV